MMKFGPRELVFLIVLVAMPVSSYWFVFKPRNEEIAQAQQEIEHKELMLEKLSAATEQTDDLAAANERIAGAIELVESRLPGTKEVDVILDNVSELARESRLSLDRVKAGRPVTAARYMEQPLEMEISGNFDDFYRFMLELERLERITRVLDMKLRRDDQRDGVMRATFTLSIYFEPAPLAEVSG
jgi:type IV pilus assembly protein PilO